MAKYTYKGTEIDTYVPFSDNWALSCSTTLANCGYYGADYSNTRFPQYSSSGAYFTTVDSYNSNLNATLGTKAAPQWGNVVHSTIGDAYRCGNTPLFPDSHSLPGPSRGDGESNMGSWGDSYSSSFSRDSSFTANFSFNKSTNKLTLPGGSTATIHPCVWVDLQAPGGRGGRGQKRNGWGGEYSGAGGGGGGFATLCLDCTQVTSWSIKYDGSAVAIYLNGSSSAAAKVWCGENATDATDAGMGLGDNNKGTVGASGAGGTVVVNDWTYIINICEGSRGGGPGTYGTPDFDGGVGSDGGNGSSNIAISLAPYSYADQDYAYLSKYGYGQGKIVGKYIRPGGAGGGAAAGGNGGDGWPYGPATPTAPGPGGGGGGGAIGWDYSDTNGNDIKVHVDGSAGGDGCYALYYNASATGGGGIGGCLFPDAQIFTTQDTSVNIVDFERNSNIAFCDPNSLTWGTQRTLGKFFHSTITQKITIVLQDGKQLAMTVDHPILTQEGLATYDANDTFLTYQVGTLVATVDGYIPIVSITKETIDPTIVYNIGCENTIMVANGIIVAGEMNNDLLQTAAFTGGDTSKEIT